MNRMLTKRPRWINDFFTCQSDEESIHLEDFESIAKYSFIVHKSINPLDISLNEFSSLRTKRKIIVRLLFCLADPAYSKKFVSTEESCRKTLVLQRRVLYTWHLDLPKGREDRLQSENILNRKKGFPKSVSVNQLKVDDQMYQNALRRFILESFERHGMGMTAVPKLLALMSKLFRPGYFGPSLEDKILNFLYLQCTDSNVVKDFLAIFHFNSWVLTCSKPGHLEYLLHHANRSRHDLGLNNRYSTTWNLCYFQSHFLCAEKLLQYQYSPCYSNTTIPSQYFFELNRIDRLPRGWRVADWRAPVEKGLMSQRRFLLWLQVIHAFLADKRDIGVADNTLRLLWRSLPDAYFTLEEVLHAYKDRPNTVEHNTAIHAFYVKNLEVVLETHQPRSLQHYCRTTIRRKLCYQLNLPHGIDQLKIPPKFKAFLRLETDMRRKYNQKPHGKLDSEFRKQGNQYFGSFME